MTTTARRDFITKTGRTLAGATAVAILDVPSVIAQPKVQWRMTTAWPTTLDMLHGAAQKLAKVVDEMSGGRFKIEIFPGGQLMSIFVCFDGASRGTVDGHSTVAAPARAPRASATQFRLVEPEAP